ncbi:cation-transporting P-type ATPase, partial [Escherichia coli]
PGLSENEANARLSRQRKANKTVQPWRRDAKLLLAQYKNPLVLLLIFAVFLSLILKEYSDGIIVLIVLLSTGIFGFFQERNAGRAVEKLRALLHSKVRVRRDGKEEDIPADEVVTGDIVLLSAGCMIPSD